MEGMKIHLLVQSVDGRGLWPLVSKTRDREILWIQRFFLKWDNRNLRWEMAIDLMRERLLLRHASHKRRLLSKSIKRDLRRIMLFIWLGLILLIGHDLTLFCKRLELQIPLLRIFLFLSPVHTVIVSLHILNLLTLLNLAVVGLSHKEGEFSARFLRGWRFILFGDWNIKRIFTQRFLSTSITLHLILVVDS